MLELFKVSLEFRGKAQPRRSRGTQVFLQYCHSWRHVWFPFDRPAFFITCADVESHADGDAQAPHVRVDTSLMNENPTKKPGLDEARRSW